MASKDKKKDDIKGGLADNMSVTDIADKHDVPVKDITKELNIGIKVEMEHVDDEKLSKEIALDHLFEIPDYYSRLEDMESEAKKELKLEQKGLIKKLLREAINLSVSDETKDSKTFDIYYNGRKAGHITCGPASANVFDEHTHEILDLELKEDYESLHVANQAVNALWEAHPDVNMYVVSLPEQSKPFWEKLNFHRLNDNYHMLTRGHG
jgi:phosphoribosylaminoimidazole carboxylase (NCAIR synthetase)